MNEALGFKVVYFFAFILISAFFSSAETAFTAISRIKLKSIIESNKYKFKQLERLLTDPRKLLTLILLGNNISNVAASTIATTFFFEIFQLIGFDNYAVRASIITGVVTFILLILGEITPKSIAMKNPERWAMKITRIIYFCYLLLYPIIIFLNLINSVIYKLFRINSVVSDSTLTEGEIKAIIKLGEDEGILETEEKNMLHGVLNVFDKIVREIMTPRTDMVCIEFKSSLNEVVQLITQKGHSRIPVYEDKIDNITGFVYAKDLLNLDPSIKTYNLKSFMREAVFIPETKNLKDLLHQMKSSKLHLAIVVDEHGGVSGLVTLEDIIEEIVGEIHDEYDNEEPNIKQLQPNEYIVDAGIGIEQLGTKLNIKFPEDDDYDTLAGFILSFLGTFPNKNQSFDYQNVHFIIKSIKKRRIISVGLKISVQKAE